MNTTLIHNIEHSYQQKFKGKPILIYSPGRINIIGEHTDYNEGFVFPAAIDKGIVAAIGKSNSNQCSVFAFDANESYEFSTEKFKSCIKNLEIFSQIQISHKKIHWRE